MRKIVCLIPVLLFLIINTEAKSVTGNKKNILAQRTKISPKIDAYLNEKIWEKAYTAKDFIQIRPLNGEIASKKTEVKFIYNDQALYVGAIIYDNPEDITKELSVRDQFNVSDYFGIYLDPFNDSKNAYGFFITVDGVQVDVRASDNGHGFDRSWNAVWESATRITDQGWIAEFKIPYSALRFPGESDYPWGLQIVRYNQKNKEESSWNYIDVEVDGKNHQAGVLKGIKDIEPPLRLSVLPYVSAYVENYSESSNLGYSYKGGMDLKMGINESFTLDMILIPDFGQVQSDDAIKNLSPFEVWHSEQRSFFQEGVELFRKGGIFYSRRIGSRPTNYYDVYGQVEDNEVVLNNPDQSNLINASKITGKTEKGLGIGFLNALTARMFADIEDTLSNESRKVETAPMTNYNMLVLDQSLGHHSFVSFANTNVYRGDDMPTANVSATDFRLATSDNLYAISGKASLSQKYQPENIDDLGYRYSFSAGKTSGKFRYHFWQTVESDTYDPNDMGFLRQNNEFSNGISFRYNEHQPNGRLLKWNAQLHSSYQMLYKPMAYTSTNIHGGLSGTFRNHFSAGLNFNLNPIAQHDYYEARNDGWIYKKPASFRVSHWGSPDYRKNFVVDYNFSFFKMLKLESNTLSMSLTPRLRLSEKLMITNNVKLEHRGHNLGYVADSTFNNNSVILFGQRNINNFTNTLKANYILNNKTSLSFRMRYYWMNGVHEDFYRLSEEGYLEGSDYSENHDFNFNALNVDMVFLWNFAPGSEMTLVWKNAIQHSDQGQANDIIDNINNTLDSPMINSLSVKVLYYLDYQSIKARLSKNLS